MRRYGSSERPKPISTRLLSPSIGVLEQTRRDLQLGMLRGWGSWMNTNILDVVMLPSALRFRTEVCHLPTNVCLNSTVIQHTTQVQLVLSLSLSLMIV